MDYNTKFEVVRLFRTEGQPLKAIADILIPDLVIIKGFRIIETKKGFSIKWPSVHSIDEKFYGIIVPLSKKIKNNIETCILEAYETT